MNAKSSRIRAAGLAGALALLVLAPAADALAAATQVKPGFNVFSTEQDIEIGRQSAQQAERQIPILNDRVVDAYVEGLFRNLAAQAPGAKYPYQVQVVNASDVNAFALPGGFVYVNRGTLAAARTNGEVAGVLAHEIAHVALRHGTHNASRAYIAQAGLGVLGGILGRGQSRTTQSIIDLVGGLGLNAVFLKNSRDAETQADIVGAQIMARGGYDPMEMVNFFELLRQQQKGNPGSVAQFLSDHPAPANREARVRQEAQLIGAVRRTNGSGGELRTTQAALRGLPAAPTTQQIASGTGRTAGSSGRAPSDTSDGRYPSDRQPRGRSGEINVEPPSSRFVNYRQPSDFFSLDIPENWRAYESDNGVGVTFVPDGGVIDTGNGQQSIVYGAIINHFDPFQGQGQGQGGSNRRGASLQVATDDLVREIQQSNQHLRVTSRARRQDVDGQPGLSLVMSGTSPATGQEERVTVSTRELSDGHVVYGLFIAPGRDYSAMSSTFSRMMNSLQVNEQAEHR